MSWLYSRALVEEFSLASCSGIALSAPSNGIDTPQAFSCDAKTMATFSHSRSGMTCGPLTAAHGEALLTWFLAASRAKTSAPPAQAMGSTESAPASGERWPAWFAKWSPSTFEWKTAQCSLLGDSESYSETWPRSGLMRDGMCYPQPTLAPRICVNGSGSLLPTLTVCGNYNRPAEGTQSGYGLATALRMLPTLCAVDTGSYFNKSQSEGATLRPTLGAMAKHNLWPERMLPTLTATCGDKGGLITPRKGREGFEKRQEERRGHTLPAVLDQESNGQGGPLNPDWCEWFMGFPIGWTASEPLETHRFREWRLQHGTTSPREPDLAPA